jgi:Peptidase M1 N-terminal domain
MWKLLFFLLSVGAQKLKINLRENVREGIEISDMSDVGSYQEADTYRLPNHTRPELYLINLNFGNFHEGDTSFTGNVFISIRVTEDTDTLILHSSVNVVDHSLTTDGNIPISSSADYDLVRNFMIVKTNGIVLKKDSLVRLTINYLGTIGTLVNGVYRGSYLNSKNERRYFLFE